MKSVYLAVLTIVMSVCTSMGMTNDDQKLLSFMHALTCKGITSSIDDTNLSIGFKHYKENSFEFYDSLSNAHKMMDEISALFDTSWISFLSTRFNSVAHQTLMRFYLFLRNEDLVSSYDELESVQKQLQNQQGIRVQEGEFIPRELSIALKSIVQIHTFCLEQAEKMNKTPEEIFALCIDRLKVNRTFLIEAFKNEDMQAIDLALKKPLHLHEIILLNLAVQDEQDLLCGTKKESNSEDQFAPSNRKERQQWRREKRRQRKQNNQV